MSGNPMLRIFAPPTSEPFLRADAAGVANFLVHLAFAVALFLPWPDQPTREELIDRFVVVLVPPDTPDGTPGARGDLVWSEGTGHGGGAPEAITPEPILPARGEAPLLDSRDLEIARRPLPGDEEEALTALDVDSAVVRDPLSAAPEYPPHLLDRQVEGHAAVRYVVDTLGTVDTLSYRVVNATDPDFAVAVRMALPRMRFRPAIQGGRKVRQLVEQTFRFKLTQAPPAPARQGTPPPREPPTPGGGGS